jgi:predicted HicB family RNase H-like nuclease
MARTSAISVRVPDAVKAAAEAAAAADRRSVASLVEKVLVDWLEAHGYLEKGRD